jgi:hypothetical protein
LETLCVATILSARRRRARRRRSASRTWRCLAAESAHVRHVHHIGERSPAAGGERPSDREPLLRAASSLGRPGRRGVAGSRCRGRAEPRQRRRVRGAGRRGAATAPTPGGAGGGRSRRAPPSTARSGARPVPVGVTRP